MTLCPRCGYGPLDDGVPEKIRELEAERDRLQADLDALNYDGMLTLRAERDRLREALEDAPHTDDCRWHDEDEDGYPMGERVCDCWKRDALEES